LIELMSCVTPRGPPLSPKFDHVGGGAKLISAGCGADVDHRRNWPETQIVATSVSTSDSTGSDFSSVAEDVGARLASAPSVPASRLSDETDLIVKENPKQLLTRLEISLGLGLRQIQIHVPEKLMNAFFPTIGVAS
jgi:hypothetical protein